MYAPFDSMVIKRDIVIGEVVNPTTPQFVLADLSRLWIMLHVRLEDVGKLSDGQEVLFHLNGANEDAPLAKINWISAEVDEKTRTVSVRADVANPKGRLRPNTFGDAHILVRQHKRLTVPNGALQFDGSAHVVFARGTDGHGISTAAGRAWPASPGFHGRSIGRRGGTEHRYLRHACVAVRDAEGTYWRRRLVDESEPRTQRSGVSGRPVRLLRCAACAGSDKTAGTAMDWTALRRECPVTTRWAYFDHAAVAPLTERARRTLVEWAGDLAENGVVHDSARVRRIEEVRRLAGQLLHADPLDIAFIKNTSEGIGIVAEGLPWQAGDNVVTAEDEYPANLYPWMNLAEPRRRVAPRAQPRRPASPR